MIAVCSLAAARPSAVPTINARAAQDPWTNASRLFMQSPRATAPRGRTTKPGRRLYGVISYTSIRRAIVTLTFSTQEKSSSGKPELLSCTRSASANHDSGAVAAMMPSPAIMPALVPAVVMAAIPVVLLLDHHHLARIGRRADRRKRQTQNGQGGESKNDLTHACSPSW